MTLRVSRIVLFSLLAIVLIVGIFVCRAWWQDQRAGLCNYVATRLTQSISADARFTEVAVRHTRDSVVVLAPKDLRASDKSELQRIVTEQGKPLNIQVQYRARLETVSTPAPP
jgi:hypothetical protein